MNHAKACFCNLHIKRRYYERKTIRQKNYQCTNKVEKGGGDQIVKGQDEIELCLWRGIEDKGRLENPFLNHFLNSINQKEPTNNSIYHPPISQCPPNMVFLIKN